MKTTRILQQVTEELSGLHEEKSRLEIDFYILVASGFVFAIPLMGLFADNSVMKYCCFAMFQILLKLLLDLVKSEEQKLERDLVAANDRIRLLRQQWTNLFATTTINNE